jgi:hypothetical protein
MLKIEKGAVAEPLLPAFGPPPRLQANSKLVAERRHSNARGVGAVDATS